MLYYKVRRLFMSGSAVIADVVWYESDPDADPPPPALEYDQIPLDAANIGAVTPDMLEAAIAARQELKEAEIAASVAPAANVAALIGHGRVMRAGRSERVNKRGGRRA